MKKLLLLAIFIISFTAISQVEQTNNSKPFIEVNGTAQKEVIPDKIYISILLTEKTTNNEDFSIQIQEDKLKEIVKKNNIEMKNLFLSDVMSQVTKNKKKDTGIKLTREYTLILKNAEEVTKIFQELTDISIKEISIRKTEYSQIENVRKEVREKAIVAAKEKAEYLLLAIGEQLGKPIEIKEIEDKPYRNLNSNSFITSENDSSETSFEKIIVKYSYYIKYSIK